MGVISAIPAYDLFSQVSKFGRGASPEGASVPFIVKLLQCS